MRIHYTWFLAFFLIAWSLGRGLFPVEYPGWSNTTYLIAGSVAALLVFGSVLFHEFAHSFMALARGLKVDNITLFVFGGAAALKSEPRRPSDEFLIAIVGPASSLLLAVIFLIASSLMPWELPARALVSQLALINAVLAIFNLLPGFPLDGGRVFRAIVWAITGSMRKGLPLPRLSGRFSPSALSLWAYSYSSTAASFGYLARLHRLVSEWGGLGEPPSSDAG